MVKTPDERRSFDTSTAIEPEAHALEMAIVRAAWGKMIFFA